jgi:hypothetical protein
VLEDCLSAQLRATPRGAIARFFGVCPLTWQARAAYRAAVHQRQTQRVFSQLGPEFAVLRTMSAEIEPDHLVIGPPGIFAVTTRGFPAKRVRVGGARFLVNGRKNGCVPLARRGAAELSRELSEVAGAHIDVTPVIVVIDPRSLSLSEPEIAVTESAKVARWFAGMPRSISDDTAEYLAAVAAMPGTWQRDGAAGDDEERHADRFDRLRLEVEAARERAHHWMYAALSVLAGAAAVAAVASSSTVMSWMGLS